MRRRQAAVARSLGQALPDFPGLSVASEAILGCGLARGTPYRYFGSVRDEPPQLVGGGGPHRSGSRCSTVASGPTRKRYGLSSVSASMIRYAYPCSARKRWRCAAYSVSRVSRATTV